MREIFRSPPHFIDHHQAGVPPAQKANVRLEIDFADLLIGPTCGSNAARYAKSLTASPAKCSELVARMQEMINRYNKAQLVPCHDCGSDLHGTDSASCPVSQREPEDRE